MIHALFDLLAMVAAAFGSACFRRHFKLRRPNGVDDDAKYHYYLVSLLIGMTVGSVLFGTLNMRLSDNTGLAKSMLGGVFGAIVAAELYKYLLGIKKSTGLYFVPGLAVMIVVGRIGCYLAGLDDFTYGIESRLPWAVDFGDGVLRHPVQLYESAALAVFLVALLGSYARFSNFWLQQGFYLFVFYYAAQRFIWEFFKPYATLVSGLNIFHILCLILMLYALMMFRYSSQPSVKHV